MSKKIVILVGSVQKNSNTMAAAKILGAYFEKAGYTIDLVDPKTLTLLFPGQEGYADESKGLQDRLKGADGLVIATPEYDGTISSVIKNQIEYLGYPSVMIRKPVALFGVASGRIGAVKALEHLRSICGSTGMLVLPNSVSVPQIHNEIADGKLVNDYLEEPFKLPVKEFDTFFSL